jgi:FtsP/CotA-like multicopper oxidase with cupredoxin domain
MDQSHGNGRAGRCHIVEHEDNDMMRPFIVNP